MRKQVNDQALDLIHAELARMKNQELSDKNRDWVVSVLNATRGDRNPLEDTSLATLSDAELINIIHATNYPTSSPGTVAEGQSVLSHVSKTTGTA